MDANTATLRHAVEARFVGAEFEKGFPKYAWAWVNGRLWECRHIRGPVGAYNAYGPLEDAEFPLDAGGMLEDARQKG